MKSFIIINRTGGIMDSEDTGNQQPELKDCKVEFNSRTQEYFILIKIILIDDAKKISKK